MRAQDCIASIQRWSKRDAFGQTFASFVEGYDADDARTFSVRLKKPFPMLPAALGKTPSLMCAMMPERLARTDAFQQVPELLGSGPFRFKADERVPGSLKVFPVKDFGAIAQGTHRFCPMGSTACAGEADFVMVWRERDGQWQVTRVLSYAHRPAP